MSRHPAGGIANISKVRYFEHAGTKVLYFSTLVSAACESSESVPDVDDNRDFIYCRPLIITVLVSYIE